MNIEVNGNGYRFKLTDEEAEYGCCAENIFKAKEQFLKQINDAIDNEINYRLSSYDRLEKYCKDNFRLDK